VLVIVAESTSVRVIVAESTSVLVIVAESTSVFVILEARSQQVLKWIDSESHGRY
jgi:hypothetical protein